MSLFGIIQFTAPYLPWVILLFSLVLGNPIETDVLGQCIIVICICIYYVYVCSIYSSVLYYTLFFTTIISHRLIIIQVDLTLT